MTAFDVYETEFKKVLPSIDARYFFKKPVRMSELVTSIKEETNRISTVIDLASYGKVISKKSLSPILIAASILRVPEAL
jgi:hypothetical protein